MRLRHVTWLLFGILLAGCGKKGHEHLPWPASVNLNGISESDAALIRNAFTQMNDEGGKMIVQETSERGKYPIAFQIVEFPKSETQAGLATIEDTRCTIQLARHLFTDPSMSSYLVPVVWHELGHCAGLKHNPIRGEIMFASTVPFERYSPKEIARFFADLFDSSSL